MPRVYEIDPTKRVAFDERFRDDAVRAMEFYDLRILAMWESGTDDRAEFIYMLDWPDQEPTGRDVVHPLSPGRTTPDS